MQIVVNDMSFYSVVHVSPNIIFFEKKHLMFQFIFCVEYVVLGDIQVLYYEYPTLCTVFRNPHKFPYFLWLFI